jgi:hypothetical protein
MTLHQTITFIILSLLIPAVFAQRMYDSSGRALGRVDAERFYSASGQQMGGSTANVFTTAQGGNWGA